jgi:hypothetical protein
MEYVNISFNMALNFDLTSVSQLISRYGFILCELEVLGEAGMYI